MSDTLIVKIAKAALDVGGKLSADRTNKEQSYDYLSADKILSVCGQALFNQGVVVIPNIGQQDTIAFEFVDKYDKKRLRYDSTVTFQFTITDGATEAKHNWYGMGSDYTVPDKALYKAITSGHKYFLMKLLCIGAGNEDGEHESEDEDSKSKKTPVPVKATPPAPGNGKSVPAEKPWTATISLEMVKTIKTTPKGDDTGTLYWDLPSDKLAARYNQMVDYIHTHQAELTPEKLSDYQLKIEAAKAILDYRQ